ncbi:AAA family ATPase [Paracidovorax avenae]|uniref:AAA family ATPase n=1 Tax=Paracidovorax avenae TaxID=80867 RepID=UPI001AD7F67C|nr:AAA family ATPase [Paracidovorax avenae]
MNSPADRLLIALSGRPMVLDWDGARPLQFKYRKSAALLGYLIGQARREVRRELLAQWLWPDLDTQAGRANLRVVLADLQAQWRQLALPGTIRVERDWIMYQPAAGLCADLEIRTSPHLLDAIEGELPADWIFALQSDPADWLAGADEGASEEFREWLGVQRQRMEAIRSDREMPAPASPALPAVTAGSGAEGCAEVAAITLLRVQLADVDASDRHPSTPEMDALVDALKAEVRRFDGVVLATDDAGCTLGFGVDSRHTGQRWQALRCAAALAAMMPPDRALSAGATHGRVLLERAPQWHAVGWRMRLAERLAQRAEPGEIVCDESMADMAPSFGCRPLGVQRFRGMGREFTLFGCRLDQREARLPPGGDFAGSSFFGRQALVASLLQTFQASAGAGPLAVCLSGEPGVGKTRTAWECARRWLEQGGVVWMTALPEGAGTPWRTLHDLLAGMLAGRGGDGSDGGDVDLPPPARQALMSFLETRNVGRRQRADLADGLGRLLLGNGTGPVLVVVDDAHWLDPATAEFLLPLAQQQPQLRWLLNRRPDTPQPLSIPHLQEIALAPLDDDAAREVLRSLPDGPGLTPEAVRGRVASARGLPLYLLAGSIHPDGASHFNEFCHALLNRLGPLREGMEVAAVLGMLFSRDDLAHLCGEAQAADAFGGGIRAGLIVARGLGHAAFFHARLREYVLSAMRPEQLQRHARRAADRAAQQGQHARAAGLLEQAGDSAAAADAWYRAVQQALAEDDMAAACDSCARLAALGYFPGAAGIEARILHGRCLIARHGPGADQAHAVVVDLARTEVPPGIEPELLFDMQMLAYLGSSSQGYVHGLNHAKKLQSMAQSTVQHFCAAWAMGNTLFWMGRFHEARGWFETNRRLGRSLSLTQRMTHMASDLAVFSGGQLAWLFWFIGEHDRSMETIEQARAEALQSATRQDLCIVQCFHALVVWCRRDPEAMLTTAGTAWTVAESEGLQFWHGIAGMLVVLARAHAGLPVDIAAVTSGTTALQVGYRAATTTEAWFAISVLCATGNHASALALAEQALSVAHLSEHQFCCMDIWRLKAQALSELGRPEEAVGAGRQAGALARQAGADGWLAQWGGTLPSPDGG